ncbi:MAG: hypothetical protein AB7F88_01015 [Pyrinomonadaceae bacterium]
MNSFERIFNELCQSLGDWREPDEPVVLDFPKDRALPWREFWSDDSLVPINKYRRDRPKHNEPLSEDESGRLGGAVQEHGFEAIAFYKSFRHRMRPPFVEKWGVFYLATGIKFISELIEYYTGNKDDAVPLAIKFLRLHEMYHFRVDALALTVEPPLSKHLYLPYRDAYRNYSSSCVEEALANSGAWNWARQLDKRFVGLLEFAEDFMDSQPNAYARYREALCVLGGELADNLNKAEIW